MKIIKIFSTLILLVCVSWFAYSWYTREKWTYRKKCADCEALENQKQERLIGTIKILPNGKTVFTDQLLNLNYNLKPCDVTCENKKLLPFDKIGVVDYTTKKNIYFDIEGKYSSEKDEFVYSSIIVLNERKFVNTKNTSILTYDEMKEKYTALEEETFLLNASHYAGLREFLPHYFTQKQLRQPILIKEATYETSDSTLITIWFMEKQKQWQPIEKYEWKKGTEF